MAYPLLVLRRRMPEWVWPAQCGRRGREGDGCWLLCMPPLPSVSAFQKENPSLIYLQLPELSKCVRASIAGSSG